MIGKNKQKTLEQIRKESKAEADADMKAKCEAWAVEKYGEQQMKDWQKENGSLWFMPAIAEDGTIEAGLILKPITRHVLGFASEKMTSGGLYVFLEACMRECLVAGDNIMLDDDDYFIPAAMKFNAILEGKKIEMLKR